MKGAIKKLKKLRGVGLEELRVRGAQSLSVRAERLRLSSQTRVPSDAGFFKLLDAANMNLSTPSTENLLEHFRTRRTPRFFAAFDDETATRNALRARFGSDAAVETIERAARIREGRFSLLALRDLDLGDPPDWHLEPISGKHAPRGQHWSRIDYLNADVAGDKKFTWELNRHQYFTTLGRAYWLTGDEAYAETFVAHLSNWMDENPPKLGINWASSLEVSLRAISWLWAFEFFKHSRAVSHAVLTRALKFLYLHARHLETYLSTYFSPNTHLTGEALGLYYLGTLLPELRRASRWRALGRKILLAQLERHVLADGVYFERSTYYQRYTTDFYTHFLLLSRANSDESEPALEEKLNALYEHLMWITRPDGTTPYFGDDDGGRLLNFDTRAANDFRATLANGACLFKRADYKFVAGSAATEELLWLFGAEGLREFDELDAAPPVAESRAFPAGGYFVMRDGWFPDSNYLMLDCGAHGTANCGHAHADALSFDLAARGRTIITDTGTCTYTGSTEVRDYFRSTRAHNTLVIDNESSSVPAGAFSWQHVANSSSADWHEHARFTAFNGSTDGYMRLASPAEHRRSVLFLKGDYFIIRDQVETAGAHDYELNFHFTPDASPEIETGDETGVRERASGDVGLELFTFGARGKWRKTDGWISTCYGSREPAPVVSYEASGEGAQEFFSFLIPRRAGEGSARVREIETGQGRAFEISDAGVRDLLIVGARESCELRGIRSDFAGVWVRFSACDETQATEFVLIGGSRFEIEGQLRVSAPTDCNYIAGRRTERGWVLDSDAAAESEVVFEETANLALRN
jgi:uncharacterized heparinase superfamily protein